MNIIEELFQNKVLIAGMCGWISAQILKTIIYMVMNKEFRAERLFGDGGMPSGHSATVSAMATSSGLIYGVSSFQFAVTTILAVIVMHDAMGVRLETSRQAVVLNEMIELFKPMTNKFQMQERLKEFVGHTPIQVVAGSVLGIIIGFILY